MNLVVINGLPGTGKLTVAKELAEILDYKILHNHLVVDLVSSIFQSRTKPYFSLVEKMRMDLIEKAFKNNEKGLILTYVYGLKNQNGKTDTRFTKRLVDKFEKHDGKIFFIKLLCDEDELRKRIESPSRKAFGKLNKASALESIKNEYNLDAIVPFRNNLTIDNTKLPPRAAARKIAEHYGFC